jgi:hypothetical protein
MVEGVDKESQPGASAIGRRRGFPQLFGYQWSSRFRGLGALEIGNQVDSSTECNGCKESSLVGDCCYPSSLCPDGHLWAVFRAT